MGENEDTETYLKAVCFDREVAEMEQGPDTVVGSGGVRLSGGQAKRLALARTLCHKRPVLMFLLAMVSERKLSARLSTWYWNLESRHVARRTGLYATRFVTL